MKLGIVLDCHPSFKMQARYVFDTLFSTLGLPVFAYASNGDIGFDAETLLIYYGQTPPEISSDQDMICIHCDSYDEWRKKGTNAASDRIINIVKGDILPLPVLFLDVINYTVGEPLYCLESSNLPVIVQHLNRTLIGFDIIASSFHLLSRQEELTNTKRDQWNCFSAKYSQLYDGGLLEMPIVNAYAKLLFDLALSFSKRKKTPFLQKWFWPEKKEYAVCLTHDVDWVKKWSFARGLRMIVSAILRRKLDYLSDGIYTIVNAIARKPDPYWNFMDWIALEDSFGVKSTFYFSCNWTHRHDPRYSIKEQKLQDIIRKIDKGGWEIGLHGSYNSYASRDLMTDEKKRLESVLGKSIIGMRQHYLRFAVPDTWRAQSRAGFLYDTTLGYNEGVGYRAGFAFPFFPFNSSAGETINILEIPLVVMDGVLFLESKFTKKEAIEYVVKLLNTSRKYNGLLTLSWHQRAGDNEEYSDWWATYKGVLEYLRGEEAFIGSAMEISRWWLARHSLECTHYVHGRDVEEYTFKAGSDIRQLSFRLFSGGSDASKVSVDGAEFILGQEGDVIWIHIYDIPAQKDLKIVVRMLVDGGES